ncbi:MAG: protein translocase subunit SecF [Halanaerobiaceae bacterium]
MDIIGKRKIWYTISLIFIGVGLLFLIFSGLNFGIDFTGGTILQFQFEEDVTNEDAYEIFEDIGMDEGIRVQQTTEDNMEGIIIRAGSLDSDEIDEIDEAFTEQYSSADLVQTRMVGPVIGQELRVMALLALLVASLAIVLYISFRFEFRFAIVAIIALLHDVLITIGIFAILGKEVNTPFVAALLTIIGYSINDTIVIFDRIRENMKLMYNKSFKELANKAVVDTLPRSINTSVTTLITILAIYFFGGSSIKVFMLALFVGMFAGTYSSVFVASPLLVTWQNKLKASK